MSADSHSSQLQRTSLTSKLLRRLKPHNTTVLVVGEGEKTTTNNKESSSAPKKKTSAVRFFGDKPEVKNLKSTQQYDQRTINTRCELIFEKQKMVASRRLRLFNIGVKVAYFAWGEKTFYGMGLKLKFQILMSTF